MKIYKFFNLILLIIFTQFITSCSSNSSMKPEDFKDKKPRLIIEEYLAGEVKAWGILQNRSGKVTRQFSATLNGLWEVFNRIQENIMEGNFQYKTNDNKLRYARVIKNFKQDIDLNKKMFSTALTYAA